MAHGSVQLDAAAFERVLLRIIEISAALIEALSEMAWAIKPASGSLAELASRMRRLAADLFATKQMKVRITNHGHGFDQLVASDGHGLTSLASRAKQLSGALTTRSSATASTDLPLLTDPQASITTRLSPQIVD